MTPVRGYQRVVAWTLAAVTVAGCAAQATLLAASGVPLLSADALDQAFPIIPLALMIGAVVGAVIVQEHPGHRIGWLFCIGQAGTAIGLATQALASGALSHALGVPVGLGQLAAWLSRAFGASYALTLLGLLLLLVPGGKLLSRRWRPVAALSAGGYLLVIGGLLMIPPDSFTPSGPTSISQAAVALELIGQIGITIGLIGGAVSLVVRLRRSHGEERQQLRWIGVGAFALAVTLLLYVVDNLVSSGHGSWWWVFAALFYLGFLSVPVATGFAVLRYRLYDIDIIIGSAVKLAVLGAFVTAGYVTVVVATSAILNSAVSTDWISVASYVLTALAFQPLRRHVARLSDRIVYGTRAAPYESLATFGRQLAGAAVSEQELLMLVARSTATAFGVRGATATVLVPDRDPVTQRWPETVDRTDVVIPVRYRDEVVGRIGVAVGAGSALRRADRRLLADFAGRAAPAFHNAALAVALRNEAEELVRQDVELTAARRRLVTAAVVEREQVAAALGSTVTAELRSVPPALDRVRDLLPVDPAAAAAELRRLQDVTVRAIEGLRGITSGVLPPLLARHGLVAALQTFAARSGRSPVVSVQGDAPVGRFGSSTETAAYAFCIWAVEALKPGSRVQIEWSTALRLTVTGEPDPDDPTSAGGREHERGWQHVVDRVEALGGQLRRPRPSQTSAAPSRPVAFEAVLPAPAQAASSGSGPKADLSM